MKRPTIGIPFNYDESWIGGTYYIKNLVSSLNLISPDKKPDVWIISHSESSYSFIKDSTGYSRLHWIKPALINGIDGGISRKTKLFSIFTPNWLKSKLEFDLVFPYPIDTKFKQTACWIPDFQEKHWPNFFSKSELDAREYQHRSYIENFNHIVFSSNAARQDFEIFYPGANVEKHVVHFATFEPNVSDLDTSDVLNRYGLPENFFYCPNQFWIHKNHETVIKAVNTLKERGINITVAFSGKEHDHRAPDHAKKLREKVVSYGLDRNVRFLGFIPREDQMTIFKSATCIIQPSLFEGWSTVIEDAKSISQYVIASNISANLEQANENIEYFEATDYNALADLLEKYSIQPPARKHLDYDVYQQEFARSFMDVVYAVMKPPKL